MDRNLIAEQLASIIEDNGVEYLFGEVCFVAMPSQLRPDDPRLLGINDRTILLTVATAEMPDPRPAPGDAISDNGRLREIIRIDDQPNGLTEILLAA